MLFFFYINDFYVYKKTIYNWYYLLCSLTQLLIGYECGLIVLWDMRAKAAELRWQFHEPLRSAAWHFEGKHFVTSHTDGSLCTWPLRTTGPPGKPQLHVFPHGKYGHNNAYNITLMDGKIMRCEFNFFFLLISYTTFYSKAYKRWQTRAMQTNT